MANRNFPSQRVYSQHLMMVQLDCQITIGASGAVSSISGLGVASATKLATGIYQIQLQDNYNGLIQVDADMSSPTTGSAITAGSFVTGTPYRITTLGTTNWAAIGLPAGVTPAIGMSFVATGAGTGTGTATAVGNSGVGSVELISTNSGMLNNQPFQAGLGGFIQIQTLGATSSSVTTAIPVNPANGSVINIVMLLNNSSVQ